MNAQDRPQQATAIASRSTQVIGHPHHDSCVECCLDLFLFPTHAALHRHHRPTHPWSWFASLSTLQLLAQKPKPNPRPSPKTSSSGTHKNSCDSTRLSWTRESIP